MKSNSLPVLVYHRVNNLGDDITEVEFEMQMRYLADHGYRTIFLKDWVQGQAVAGGKVVAITFDDGYLDNWIYAYPILKKYGLRATIFIITARPRDDVAPRLKLDDIWSGKISRTNLPEIVPQWQADRKCVLREDGSPDFVTWEEMQEMTASGHIDIQSHSHYHRDFFISNQIVDFNQNKYFGTGWATDGDTRYGIPIYPRKSAMMARRYFDDVSLRDYLFSKVKGPEYFSGRRKNEYMMDLLKSVAEYKAEHELKERFESKEEQARRILSELIQSKRTIEDRLGKPCDLICWPWGEYSSLSIDLARQAGYRGAVAFSPGNNRAAIEPYIWHIKRFPPARNIDEFARALKRYSSPTLAALSGWGTMLANVAVKVRRRAREGELRDTLKRRMVRAIKK